MSVVDIIIPTWNNPQYLYSCVQSIIRFTCPEGLFKIYVVNNGAPEHMEPLKALPQVTILQQKENLGWEGGLKAGLEASDSPYVVFLNDDTYIPPHSSLWLDRMLNHFAYPDCGAVGPSSNVVMGKQNIFSGEPGGSLRVKFLIGFCFMVKRETFMQAGGIDTSLPGGDDLDMSIRIRKLGKYLVCDRDVFVFHHGFKTGERVKGSEWNSAQMQEATIHALIRKHGLREYLDLYKDVPSHFSHPTEDTEAEVVRQFIQGRVLELGCGDKKTVPDAVGVDIVPKGEMIKSITFGRVSVADIQANVQEKLPVEKESFDTIIARHVLEHMIDTVEAVKNWSESLKHGGRIIIAVPNDEIRPGIPLNFEHKHAWTPMSLKNFMESMGWKTIDLKDSGNMVSLVGCFEKNGVH